MFPVPLRRGSRFVSSYCTEPEDPSRKPKSKSRYYNKKTGRWEWGYCY